MQTISQMEDRDKQLIMAWAAERGVPFTEDDIPFLAREISKLNITVGRWCELQDKQQEEFNLKFAPKG